MRAVREVDGFAGLFGWHAVRSCVCVCVCVERVVVIAFIIGAIFCPKALYLLFKRDLEFVERYIKRSQKKKAGKQTYAKSALLYSAEKTGGEREKGSTQAWQ